MRDHFFAIKKRFWAQVELFRISKSLNIIEQSTTIKLSPVEQHLALNQLLFSSGHFHVHYHEWRMKRINKILDIFGVDYFKDKNILELGGGNGNIGAFFADLGANVLSLEGRNRHVTFANLNYRNLKNFKCVQFNLENDFSEFGKFDLIINFGLLYHIKNIDEHLNCCAKMSDNIILESEVCDSSDPDKIIYIRESNSSNEALDGIGGRPSPFYVERILEENNFKVLRFFENSINTDFHVYDWKHKNNDRVVENHRRFWLFKKNK